MDCPTCGTYLWETTKPCPNCNAPAVAADPMAEPAPPATEIETEPMAAAETEPAPWTVVAPHAPWQPAKPYRPSGRMGAECFPKMALISLAAAVGVGLVYHYISKFLNIFLLMPIGGGFIVGVIIGGVVTKRQCRSPVLAATLGLLAGLIAYGGDYVLNAVEDRSAIIQAVSNELVQDDNVAPAAARQFAEKNLTPWLIFRMDFQARAASGITVSNYGAGGAPVTGWGYYGIVALETMLFTGFATALPMGLARKRYCETCNLWHRSDVVYLASPTVMSPIVSAVQAHDWEAAATIQAKAPMRTKANVSVSVERCPNCNDASISATSTDGKKVRKVFEYSLPIDDVQQLIAVGHLKSA